MPSALTWSAIESASPETRQNDVLSSNLTQRPTRKLLSPAEAINVFTIGACHSDNVVPNGSGLMAIDPYTSQCLPNPSSALGLGFRRGVKPDLLMPGGREHVRSQTSHAPINLRPVDKPGRAIGIGVACPGMRGETDRKINSSGTSEATALATNAAMLLEAIEEIPDDPAYPQVDPKFHAVILKSLLVHTARWDDAAAATLKALVNNPQKLFWHERDEISRFLGFGCPDIGRVLDCAAERATLIAGGTSALVKRMSIGFLFPPHCKALLLRRRAV